MARKNFRTGDKVTLNCPYQMLGFGKLPQAYYGDTDYMLVIKRTRAGLYQCITPNNRDTVSLAKEKLDLFK